jgi:hypothetical protein
MHTTDGTPYEAPKVIASLDALGLIADADGMAVGALAGSQVLIHEAPRTDTRRDEAGAVR